MRRRLALAAVAAASLAAAGCGVGPGSPPSRSSLTITQAFGSRPVAQFNSPRTGGSDTVMRLLQRNTKVSTRYGGGFVQSIAGLSGGSADGAPVDWFYYVNGVEAPKGAAATVVHGGDRIWWDRHDWTATQRVQAVVGSFPEPFLHGIDGKRLPVRIECADGTPVCDEVQKSLTEAGVLAGIGSLRQAVTTETLRVLVGPWIALREDPAAASLERGPAASGVYARPSRDGRSIALLDPQGRVRRTVGAGSGLVAATRLGDDQPVWMVTGTDAAGVEQAAKAFDEGTLHDKFAVAVANDLPIPLPEAPAQ